MNEDLPRLIDESQTIAIDAEKLFGNLSAEQLNWRPDEYRWSVAQCFQHLIEINQSYFARFREIASSRYSPSLKERIPLVPRLFGSLILKAVQPQSKRKFKSVARFQPTSSDLGGDIIARFKAHQAELVGLMKQTNRLNLRRIIITPPVVSYITYSLDDAYKIIVAHERRHMLQAQRVMEMESFPEGEHSRSTTA